MLIHIFQRADRLSSEFDSKSDTCAPRQSRSRATADRLIAATLSLLHEGGLAACTVPAIAARAEVAVGTIYRRYPDKDRMIAEAILSLYAQFEIEGSAALDMFFNEVDDLEEFLFRLSMNISHGIVANRTLMDATRDFSRASKDEDFLARFEALRGQPREALFQAAWKRFGSEVKGGELSLRLALASLHGTVHLIYFEQARGLFQSTPDQRDLARELARMQAAYLMPPDRPSQV